MYARHKLRFITPKLCLQVEGHIGQGNIDVIYTNISKILSTWASGMRCNQFNTLPANDHCVWFERMIPGYRTQMVVLCLQ